MFVKLELSILKADLRRLSGADFRVLFAMSRYIDHAGRCFPGISRLVADLNVERREVQPSVRRLEEAGLVRTQRGGGCHRPNQYWLPYFTCGKGGNSDKLGAVLNPIKGGNFGKNSGNLVSERASNLPPEPEVLRRTIEEELFDDFFKKFKNRPPRGHQYLPAPPAEETPYHPSRKELAFYAL